MSSVLPSLCVALSGITFGTIGYFGTKLFEAGFSGAQMLFWRFILAAIFILPFIRLPKHANISVKALAVCFLLGCAFYSLSTYCFFSAIPHIGSGVAMVIFYLFPLLVALMNWVIDKRKLSITEILTLVLIIPGMILLSVSDNAEFNTFGILLGFGSALFYGIYFYTSQKIGQNIPSLLTSLMVCLGNAFFFSMFCLYDHNFYVPQTPLIWLQCIGFAFIGTVLPLWLLFYGLKKVNITKAALVSVLEPISTVLIGLLALAETLSGHQVFGMVIILFAALMVQFNVKGTKTNGREHTFL